MPLYLCRVIGDGKTPETAFRPAIADFVNRWSVLDARADATKADGWMLVRVKDGVQVPARALDDPRIRAVDKALVEGLGVQVDARLSAKKIESLCARKLLAEVASVRIGRQVSPDEIRTKFAD